MPTTKNMNLCLGARQIHIDCGLKTLFDNRFQRLKLYMNTRTETGSSQAVNDSRLSSMSKFTEARWKKVPGEITEFHGFAKNP